MCPNVDWEQVLKEHKERVEKETSERIKRLKRQEEKRKSLALYTECKTFLESNEQNWEKRRYEREQEQRRKNRLLVAEKKHEELKERLKQMRLEEELNEKMNLLPEPEREKLITEENLERRKEIAETRKSLWKLRNKENKYKKSSD